MSLEVADLSGKVLRKFEGTHKLGLNRVVWTGFGGFGGGGGGFQRGGAPANIEPGQYVVTLQIGEKKLTQKAVVLPPVPAN